MLERVAVMGGGRWSRVLVGVLHDIEHTPKTITVHSRRNSAGMREWVDRTGRSARVRVFSEWPSELQPGRHGVIVVTAPEDHEAALEWALNDGVAALVEKPFALSGAAAHRLVALAERRRARLAAAHVFRFARYVDRFAAAVTQVGPLRSLRVEWSDPSIESRYGEAKRHDPNVNIVADVLPHVLSLIRPLVPNGPDRCERATFRNAGLDAEIGLVVGTVPCELLLSRNAPRRRAIQAAAGEAIVTLDFSEEPGVIDVDGMSTSADPDWTMLPKPVARMLTSFTQWAANDTHDERLSVDLGMRACDIVDKILTRSEGGIA